MGISRERLMLWKKGRSMDVGIRKVMKILESFDQKNLRSDDLNIKEFEFL
ncbi:MAG: hypothetical protein ISEC1_P1588 [Thiomicrorhabdus sp.]|nr:MAG: hypothetical protein ISEC1_P1588 [Thiomicrorhabdus sp.]